MIFLGGRLCVSSVESWIEFDTTCDMVLIEDRMVMKKDVQPDKMPRSGKVSQEIPRDES